MTPLELFLGLCAILFFVTAFIAIPALIAVFWVLMFIKCIQRQFTTTVEKVSWIVVLILLGGIGAVIFYFVVVKAQKPKKRKRRK